jgi:hypothetical protein
MFQGGRPGGGLFLFYSRGRRIRLLGQLLGVSNIEQLSDGK